MGKRNGFKGERVSGSFTSKRKIKAWRRRRKYWKVKVRRGRRLRRETREDRRL